MSYGIGGYQLIDFKGIDLINGETLNNNVYNQIEKANKNKPLCIVNIVKDKIEYQAQFINVVVDNSNFTFYLLDRFIKVSQSKIESLPIVNNKTIDVNDYNLYITNDFLSYNHTEIISFTMTEGVFTCDFKPIENIETPYNIIITNPIGPYKFNVEQTPSLNNEISFEGYTFSLNYNNIKYNIEYFIKVFNLQQLVIKVIDRNIFLSFITDLVL